MASIEMPTFKMVLCGPVKSGKSSLLTRLVENKFNSKYIPTSLCDFRFKTLPGNVKIQIWDTAPAPVFKTLVQQFYRAPDAIVMVFDSQCQNILVKAQEWADSIRAACSVPFFIVLNKSDLSPLVSNEVLDTLKDSLQCPVFQVSAATGAQVSESFRSIVGTLMKSTKDQSCPVSEC